MSRIKRFNEFVLESAKDKFCIINSDKKYITARFSSEKGNVPNWTDNFEFAYTYDTTEEAQAAADALVKSGFMEEGDYDVVPFVKPTHENSVDAGLSDADFAKALLKLKFLGEKSADTKLVDSKEDIDNSRKSTLEDAIQKEDETADVEINSDYKLDIDGDVREVSLTVTEYYEISYDKSSGDDVTPSTFDYDMRMTGKTIEHIYVDGSEVEQDAELKGLVQKVEALKK